MGAQGHGIIALGGRAVAEGEGAGIRRGCGGPKRDRRVRRGGGQLADGDRVGGGGGGRRAIQHAQHPAAADGDAARGAVYDAAASLILGLGGKGGQGADAENGDKEARPQGAVPQSATIHPEPAVRPPQDRHNPAA